MATLLNMFLLPGMAMLCLAFTALYLGRRGRARDGFRPADYAVKPLLTRWELAALGEMRHELPPSLHICPQVRLADLLTIRPLDAAIRQAALNRVAMKSVDFVVIDSSGRALLVVELDDRTHLRAERQKRDALVDAVLGQCGIPIRRVRPGQRVGALRMLAKAGFLDETSSQAGSRPDQVLASPRTIRRRAAR